MAYNQSNAWVKNIPEDRISEVRELLAVLCAVCVPITEKCHSADIERMMEEAETRLIEAYFGGALPSVGAYADLLTPDNLIALFLSNLRAFHNPNKATMLFQLQSVLEGADNAAIRQSIERVSKE